MIDPKIVEITESLYALTVISSPECIYDMPEKVFDKILLLKERVDFLQKEGDKK